MPNLEQVTVLAWLTELRPTDTSAWPPAIRALETSGRAPEHLAALGEALDALAPADLPQLRDALRIDPVLSGMRAVLAQLGAARTLRLLHWLAEVDVPECHAVIAALSRGNDTGARALRATVTALIRAATVRRMFAPERITALDSACATVQEQFI